MPPIEDTVNPALTATQEATLEHVLECIHPEDEMGPGAVTLGLPTYVIGQLEGDLRRLVPYYRLGLDGIEELAVREAGASFAALAPAAQEEMLRVIDAHDVASSGPLATKTFLDLAVEHAYEGLFGDPAYGGNVDGAGWRLVGYPGPRPVVPAGQQLLDVVSSTSSESIFGVEMFAGGEPS